MQGEGAVMCEIPLVDWNGNGRIDTSDIAISLAMMEEEEIQDQQGDRNEE